MIRTVILPLLALLDYVVLLLWLSKTPLRLGEYLQAFASLNFSWSGFVHWIALTPGGVPLGYLLQLPFALGGDYQPFFLRLPSILSAAAACWLFCLLAERIPIKGAAAATVLFALMPVHLQAATQGRPFELALLLLILATLQFASLLERPSLAGACGYAALLTLVLFTRPEMFLPAVGYALFLLRFVGTQTQRQALWYVLPATALPPVLYLPFYAWASPQRSTNWLTERGAADADPSIFMQELQSLTPGALWPWTGFAVLGILICGLLIGCWLTFAPFRGRLKSAKGLAASRPTLVFCLAGGPLISLVGAAVLNVMTKAPLFPDQILAALPGLLLVAFAALERTGPLRWVFAAVLLLLTLPANFEYATTSGTELTDLTRAVSAQMGTSGDSCVVFVSQRESSYFFLFYDPALAGKQCENFFHKRIVLASHPWVTPDEQHYAESFFRGLNFKEVYRQEIARGQVVTLQNLR